MTQSAIWMTALLTFGAIPLAAGSAEQTYLSSTTLDSEQWLAVRFNVTADSDLALEISQWGCTPHDAGSPPVAGIAWLDIRDGQPRFQSSLLSHVGQLGVVEVAAGPAYLRTQGIGGPLCGGTDRHFWGGSGVQRSATILLITAHASDVSTTATWSKGVTSFDVQEGKGIMRTKAQFDTAVRVHTYPLPSASASVHEMSMQTSRDFVGWFKPEAGPGVHLSECTRNGGSCGEPDGVGNILLAGTGATEWHVSQMEATIEEPPYYALGGIELPDNSYLR